MQDEVQRIQELAEAGDLEGVIEELTRLHEAGKLQNAALQVCLPDGRKHEVVVGAASEEEHAMLLANLHSKLATKH